MMAAVYVRNEPEFEAMQYTGPTSASAIKAWADGHDDEALAITRDGDLIARNQTSERRRVPVGSWIVASTRTNPPVFLEEETAFARKYRLKP